MDPGCANLGVRLWRRNMHTYQDIEEALRGLRGQAAAATRQIQQEADKGAVPGEESEPEMTLAQAQMLMARHTHLVKAIVRLIRESTLPGIDTVTADQVATVLPPKAGPS